MSDNLKNRTINGIIWSFTERVGHQAIRFIITVILARLLLPEQFGLIGMLAIFIAISRTFLDSGFGAALIQKKDTTQSDYSTVFYFNIVIGLLSFAILYFTAPLIATFYEKSQLIALTRFIGLSIVINSFGLIQNTILIKKIDFKTLTKVNLLSVFLSGCIAILMALKGFGVWSLAVHVVSMNFFVTILLWFFNNWRPTLEFSKKAFKNLFSYGSKLLASSLINTIFQNIYLVVIGKTFAARQLGFYTQANRLKDYPSRNLYNIFQRVTFPVFSKIQDENSRLKKGYKNIIKTLTFINFPLMLGLIVVADPLIRVLLTEKWLPAVPYFQLLCIVGFLYPIQSLNLNIIKVKGRSDLFLKLEIIKKIIIALAIVICLQFGILALIIGQVITSFVAYFINSYYSGRFIDYGIKEQITDILPYLSMAIFMAIATWSVGFLFGNQHILKLLVQIIFAIGIYSTLSKILKLDAFKEAVVIFRINILKKRLA